MDQFSVEPGVDLAVRLKHGFFPEARQHDDCGSGAALPEALDHGQLVRLRDAVPDHKDLEAFGRAFFQRVPVAGSAGNLVAGRLEDEFPRSEQVFVVRDGKNARHGCPVQLASLFFLNGRKAGTPAYLEADGTTWRAWRWFGSERWALIFKAFAPLWDNREGASP
jgi:hypothetical protein